MSQPVLVAGARTPIGKMLGGLSRLQAPALGAASIRAALDRGGIAANQVDAVILGNVVQAGVGPNPARLAAVAGGVPMSVPATTVNKLCLSGLAAIAQAAQLIMTGYYEVVVAGGMESMSNAPHLLPGSRRGVRYGEAAFLDALDSDALVCGFDGISMGAATERYQAGLGISRQDQDAFGAESHARAAAAIKAGRLAEEIVPLTAQKQLYDKEGKPTTKETVTLAKDEGNRPETTLESLAALKPVWKDGRWVKQGAHITAGNASQLSDGAAAVLLMSAAEAKRRGLAPLGVYRGAAVAGCKPDEMGIGPVFAIPKLLAKHGLSVADIGLWELNEAFACQVLYCRDRLGIPNDRLNVDGGAISIGHPFGMSGARMVGHALVEGRRRGVKYAVVTMCIGGGMGAAALFEIGR